MIAVASDLRGPTFSHAQLPYTGRTTGTYELTATLIGFEGAEIDPESVELSFRVDGGDFAAVALVATGEPGEFGGSIAAQPDGALVEYYLSGADVMGRSGLSPRGAPDALYTFEVGESFTHPMEADRGWTVGDADDDASSGIWVRVEPVGTDAQPDADHSEEGTFCWVTGQHTAGESLGYNDVDGGKTTLLSPVYDFAGASEVSFSYWKWYSNDQGNAPNADWWDVLLSNDGGATWIEIEHTETSTNAWADMSFDLFDYVESAGQVQLKFVAADEGDGSVVEAAVDDFAIAGMFTATAVGDAPEALRVQLAQNAPNPFNPLTTIRFALPTAGRAHLGVFDSRGRLIKSLVRSELPAGQHAVTWNGRDALGRPVASGTYFYKLMTPDGRELTRKMLLMK